MAPTHVLFDLDGTLSDSAPGILKALRHAFEVNGLAPMSTETELAILGPPFYESLPPIIGAERVPDVIAAYRAHYGDTSNGGGMFDTVAYPGVSDLLAALHHADVVMAVATSKSEPYAVPIVEHLGFSKYFATVGGDALDGSRSTKALVIGHVLDRLGNPDPADVIMIGDRSHDVLGARAHGIDTIAITWGYAVPGELEAAQPRHVAATAAEVAEVLGLSKG